MSDSQRLYRAASRPLCWLGLTPDEWGILAFGIGPGLFLINGEEMILGFVLVAMSVVTCWGFKKFKALSDHFLVKSWLVGKGILPPPSKLYPHMLGERVGR